MASAVLAGLAVLVAFHFGRKQLALAQAQADARPRLRVSEVRLVDLDEAGMQKRVEPYATYRRRRIRWEQGREVREERKRQEDAERTPEERRARQELERLTREMSLRQWESRPPSPSSRPPHETPEGYEGPIPDKVLMITVTNDGDEAAYEVAGWLRWEADHLEPARYFSSPNTVVSLEEGVYRVKVGGTEKATLHGTRSARLRFKVAVAVRAPGTTRIEYDFSPAAGKGDRGEEVVEAASE